MFLIWQRGIESSLPIEDISYIGITELSVEVHKTDGTVYRITNHPAGEPMKITKFNQKNYAIEEVLSP
jgi:hypothetical protein